jgi:hypothetical protein
MPSTTKSNKGKGAALRAQTFALLPEINARAVSVALDVARQLCPVSNNSAPGHTHLRDTITAEVDKETGVATLAEGDEARGVTLERVLAVEFGTAHMAARAHNRPGVEAGQAEAKKAAKAYRPKG